MGERCTQAPKRKEISSQFLIKKDDGPYREKTVANVYVFHGEYTFSEPLFYPQRQRWSKKGKLDEVRLTRSVSWLLTNAFALDPGTQPRLSRCSNEDIPPSRPRNVSLNAEV